MPTLDTTALCDIEGPFVLSSSFPWKVVLGTVLGLSLGFILYKLYYKRRSKTQDRPPVSAYDEALTKLSQVYLGANAASFATTLSDILRTFIQYKLNCPVIYQTTEEFIRTLGTSSLDTSVYQDLMGFLSYCDLVKFAKAPLDQEERSALLANLRKLLDSLHNAPITQTPKL